MEQFVYECIKFANLSRKTKHDEIIKILCCMSLGVFAFKLLSIKASRVHRLFKEWNESLATLVKFFVKFAEIRDFNRWIFWPGMRWRWQKQQDELNVHETNQDKPTFSISQALLSAQIERLVRDIKTPFHWNDLPKLNVVKTSLKHWILGATNAVVSIRMTMCNREFQTSEVLTIGRTLKF